MSTNEQKERDDVDSNHSKVGKLRKETSSFLTGAEESGEAAVALGETLEKFSKVIDDMYDEIDHEEPKEKGGETDKKPLDAYSDDEDEDYGIPEESEEFAAEYKPVFPDDDDSDGRHVEGQQGEEQEERLSSPDVQETELINDTEAQEKKKKKKEANQVKGVAIAAGVVGLAAVGPLVGVAAAGGAAIVASRKKGKAGELARAGGNVVQKAGYNVKEYDKKNLQILHKVKDFDKKHAGVFQATSKVTSKGMNWVSKIANYDNPEQNQQQHETKNQKQ